MNIVFIDQVKEKIEQLIQETNETHQPILLKGEGESAVLISESDWNTLQETLYLKSIPGMVKSIQEGGNTPIEECIDEATIRNILNG
jgi:antitoxin YefM